MRAALNQPVGMGLTVEEERNLWTGGFEAKTASPPAVPQTSIMGTIVGGIKDIFSAVTQTAVPLVTQRVIYGKQTVAPTTMTTGTPVVLAPKASIPTEYLLLGGGAIALLLFSRKRGRK